LYMQFCAIVSSWVHPDIDQIAYMDA
jgi:hypothetical protein